MVMNRGRIWPSLLGWLAVLSCSASEHTPGEALDDGRPNIILIMVDDLGYETLGCYGGESYETPNLDRLAETGIRFNHAYAQPLCTPTRLQIMTGQYNFRNWFAFGLLPPNEITFGHVLQAAGYKTCISGKWQLWSYNPPDFEPEFRGLGTRPEVAGFDEWFLWHARHTEEKGSRYADPVVLDNGEPLEGTSGKYGPDLYTDYIIDFIERADNRPFFIYYPMALTHGPFNPTPHSEEWESGDRFESDERKFFGDMVEYMDFTVGRIMTKLEEEGLRERTLILFFSDNGSPRGTSSMVGGRPIKGGKGLPTDAGTRVPLIANWTGVTPPGTFCEDLIDSTDIYATIVELSGGAYPEGKTIDGISFLPQLYGQQGSPKEVILVWHDPRPGWNKENYTRLEFWARDRNWKLYDDGRLFNISNDVLEENPISEDSESREQAAARRKLKVWLDRVPAEKRKPRWNPYAAFREVEARLPTK